jgi:hypothetical protein
MIGIRRRRALAMGLAVAGAGTGLAVLASPPAQAAACSATRSSSMSVHGTGNEYEFLTHYTQSHQVVVDPREYYRKNVKTGSVTVTILACKSPKTHRWSPLTYSVNTNLNDLDLIIRRGKVTPVPADGERGFGTMVKRLTRNRLEIEPLICVDKPRPLTFLGALKFVTGLPIPVSPGKAVGLYVLNNALPEHSKTYACGLLGKVTGIPWSLSSKGGAKLKMPRTGHYVFSRRATWQEVCPPDIYCSVSHDEVLEVKAGK